MTLTAKLYAALGIVLFQVVFAWFAYNAGANNKANALLVGSLKASNEALDQRLKESNDVAAKQKEANITITKDKNDELTKVRADLANAKRVRVGSTLCPATGQTVTEGAISSDAADTGGGMVSASTQQVIDGLILKVEEGLATGRACQRFLIANDLVP